MGVKGLNSFLRQENVYRDYQLSGSSLVIDGNNLCYFLHRHFRLDSKKGGDYDKFERELRSVFLTLKKHRVKCFVVFDGAYDLNEGKLPDIRMKARERFKEQRLRADMNSCSLLPPLAFEVFKSALDQMEIRHVTCDFDADAEVATLANEVKCPVLSHDSDFLVYDIKEGVINTEDLMDRFPSEGQGQRSLYVSRYRRQHLEELLRLGRSSDWVVPLFGTLLGNECQDHRDRRTLEPILSRFSNDVNNNKGKWNLLLWLSDFRSLERAIMGVTDCLKDETHPHLVAEFLRESVQSYTNITSSKLGRYLFGQERNVEKLDSNIRSPEGRTLPTWFIGSMRDGILGSVVIRSLANKTIVLPPTMEIMTEPSVHQCSLPLRQIVYGILFSAGNSPENDLRSSYPVLVEEVGRYAEEIDTASQTGKGRIRQKFDWVKPRFQLSDETPVPSLWEIPDLTQPDRLEGLCACLGVPVTVTESVPADLRLFSLCVLYWRHSGQPSVEAFPIDSRTVISSLILCALKVGALDLLSPSMSTQDPELTENANSILDASAASSMSMSSLIQIHCTQSEITESRKHLCRFQKEPTYKEYRNHPFDPPLVHVYSEIQGCIRAGMALNALWRSPCARVSPARILNGTLYHRLYQELRGCSDPDKLIQELLGDSGFLWKLYQHLLGTLTSPSDAGDGQAFQQLCTPVNNNEIL